MGIVPFHEIPLAALLLFCALLFPFIIGYHRFPVASFYQEWIAIFLALGAAILVAAKHFRARFEWPLAAWIPLALLPGTVLHYADGNKLIVHGPPLYLIWIGTAVLFMIVGRKLSSSWKAISLADVMAAAFVAGALASCIASWHWRFGILVLDYPLVDAADGWLGQRNQNALHIWLGALGIGHFALNRRVSWFYFLVCLGILTETAIYTASRSIYLYAGCGLALGVWAAAKSGSRDVRRRLLLCGILPVVFLGAILGTRIAIEHRSHVNETGEAGSVNIGAVDRLAPGIMATDTRIGLWLAAANISLANPWIGAGPGSYIRESWVISDSLPSAVPNGAIPASHAHNLFLQISAELGAPTALVMAGLICAWLVAALRQTNWQDNWLYVAMPLVILTHNQLEFSLWYLYFLLPCALAMGAATGRIAAKGVVASAVLVVAILGFGLSIQLGQDYQNLVRAIKPYREGSADAAPLLATSAHPIFGAMASTVLTSRPLPGTIPQALLDWHAARSLYLAPIGKLALLRHAAALERSGKPAEAAIERQMTRRVFGDSEGSSR
jgi:hypothetical protein